MQIQTGESCEPDTHCCKWLSRKWTQLMRTKYVTTGCGKKVSPKVACHFLSNR